MNDETPLVREVYTDDGLTTPKTAKLGNEDLPIVISFDNTKSVDTTYYPVEVISDGKNYAVYDEEDYPVYAQLSNSREGKLYHIASNGRMYERAYIYGRDLTVPIINYLDDGDGAGGHYYYADGKIYEDESLQVPFMATLNGNQVQVGLSSDCTLTVGGGTYAAFEVNGVPVQTEDGSIPLVEPYYFFTVTGWGSTVYYKTVEYGDELMYGNCDLKNTAYVPDPNP